MKRKHHHAWLGLLIGWIILGGIKSLHAQHTVGSIDYDLSGKNTVEITSLFDKLIDSGFATMGVRIKNGLDKPASWNINFSCRTNYGEGRYTTDYNFEVQAQSELERKVLIPIDTFFYQRMSGTILSSIEIEVTSSAFPKQSFYWSSTTIGSEGFGISNSFTLPLRINGEIFSTYDAAMLHSDWRSYLGHRILLITDHEWESLDPSVRRAIHSWMLLGGILHIYTTSEQQNLEALGISGQENVKLLVWDGNALEDHHAALYSPVTTEWTPQYGERSLTAGPGSGLTTRLGEKAFGGWLIVVVLIAFGVVVGPLNLFLWAPPGRRQRLFITTPVISILTSLLLVGSILLRDGIGGKGVRVLFMRLDPEARELALTQEQITRTGVLIGGGVEFDDPTFISHMIMNKNPWSRVSRHSHLALNYSFVPGQQERFLGDWFFSRSEQAHYLQQIKPTRARLEEATTGSEKEIFSSLGFSIEKLFYRDFEGKWWCYEGEIQTGQRVGLVPGASEDYREWIIAHRSLSHESDNLLPPELPPGTFSARSRDSKAGFIETRGDIDWDWQVAILTGTMVKATN